MAAGATPRAGRLARILLGAMLVIVFAIALLAGALLHLNLPSTRRAIEHAANALLAKIPSASVRLIGLERLTLDRVEVGAVDVDVVGVGRFHTEVVRVSFDIGRTLRAALFEKRVTSFHVRSAEVSYVGVALQIEPVETPETGPPAEVRLDVDRLAVEHAYVNGQWPNGPLIDVDLDRLRASGTLDAARVRGSASTSATVRAVLPRPIEATIDASASFPLRNPETALRSAAVDVAAKVGGVHVDGHGTMLGDGVDAELVVPETPAEALKELWNAAPVAAPVSARARLGGTLPRLETHLDLAVGRGTLRADGPMDVAAGPSAELALVGREIDLHAFAESAPSSRLGLDAHTRLSVVAARAGEIPLEGWLSFSRIDGSIEREPIPRVAGRISVEPSGQRLSALVEEEGVPLRVEAFRTSDGLIQGTVEGTAPSLADVPRLARHGLPAYGRAVVRADLSVDGDVVSSDAIVDVYRAGFAGVAIGAARVEARADGPFDALRLSGFAHLIALRREPYAVNDVLFVANGTLASLEMSLAGRGGTFDVIAVQADAAWNDAIEIGGLSTRLDRENQSVVLRADKLTFGRNATSAEGVRIEGCGGYVEASASRAPGRLAASVESPAFDLGCFAHFFEIPVDSLAGRGAISLSVDLGPRRNVTKGHLDIYGAKFGPMPEVDATVDVGLDGPDVHGLAIARNRDLGGVRLEAAGTLSGSLLDAKSLARSTGRIAFTSERLALERLCAIVPCPDSLRQAVASANILVEANAELVRDPSQVEGGDAHVRLKASAQDDRGPLAHLDLSSSFDLGEALETFSIRNDAPLEGEFAVQDRSLDELPPNIRPAGLSGRLAVHGYAQGTIGKPFLAVEVDGTGLRYGMASAQDAPFDVRWVTTYDLEQAASEIHVRVGSQPVIEGVVQVDASLEKFLAGDDKSWNGGAYLTLDHFPLSSVPLEVGERMTGTVSGTISASGLHRQPRIVGRLAVDELRVGRAYAGPVALTLDADERRCAASLVTGTSARSNAETGNATLRAGTVCSWSALTFPWPDPRAPVEIALDAVRFPLGALAPAVNPWIERLRGRLDAHLEVTSGAANGERNWAIRGQAQVREGNMLPLEIGREFKQVQIDMKANNGTLSFDRLTGEVGAGHFDGTGSIQLRNLSVLRGHAEMHVPRRKAIPMTAEGVSYGTVWGDVFADAQVVDNALHIRLRAPTLRAELPPQSTAVLESLKEDPSVVVLQPLGPEKPPSAVGGGPSPGPLSAGVVITLELGDNVGISRDDMKIELTTPAPPGNPKITVDGDIAIAGSIRILGGRVPVAGRVFRIERGVVRFSGDDPADPAIDIDAVYDAADSSGARIDVHLRGTAKNVKMTLTSSPAKSESELLSILAFGEPMPGTGSAAPGISTPGTGAGATAAAGAGAAAAGFGSAILTSGVNQLLSRSIIPIRTRVATGATPLAAASVDLTERVRVEYIRQFGNIRYGQPQDVNQFALDWRFRPRWILRTVVGDRGTVTLDVLWNRWY